ncbi:MAG: glycosyltransferase [Ginsengibacter sp.]
MKPSVLVLADFPNWAYYEIQRFIKNYLSDEFDIYCDFLIFNSIKKSKDPVKRMKLFLAKRKYQQVRSDHNYEIVVYLSFYFPEYMNIKWKAKKVIKGIYTDGFPPNNSNFTGSIDEFKKRFLDHTDALVCGSEQITQFYKNIHQSVFYANGILPENHFKRIAPKKMNQSDSFILGWTGNPDRGFKGFYTHVVPAVELAKKKYPGIQLETRFSGSFETLPRFYDEVDVVLIASEADAGPSLFGEASLMDIPSISTDIGWPHEVIKNNINGFFVEKKIEAIAEKIVALYEDRPLLFAMSSRIRKDYLNKFNKPDMVNKWRNVFNEVLKDKID